MRGLDVSRPAVLLTGSLAPMVYLGVDRLFIPGAVHDGTGAENSHRPERLRSAALMMEFHIARKTRERYGFAETLFSYTGNVVLDNMPACREFAHRMNQVRDVEKNPDQAVHA